jgi:hypothetical protein
MGQLLNTEDPAEQRQRVAQLIQVANIPSLTFLIQYDQRNGMVTISGLDSAGHTLPFEVGHRMLDLGRQALTQLEVQAKQAQVPAQGEPSRG